MHVSTMVAGSTLSAPSTCVICRLTQHLQDLLTLPSLSLSQLLLPLLQHLLLLLSSRATLSPTLTVVKAAKTISRSNACSVKERSPHAGFFLLRPSLTLNP